MTRGEWVLLDLALLDLDLLLAVTYVILLVHHHIT